MGEMRERKRCLCQLLGKALPWKLTDLDLCVLMFHYLLCWLFYFYVWLRAGNIYFFSDSLNFEIFLFTVLFTVFLFLFLFIFQYSRMFLAVLVLEMFLDVLYFHSCGIVGIMMMMMVIKLARPCCWWIVRWTWALGFRHTHNHCH